MITFLDRPCGTGKTTNLLKSFEPSKRYFCVVPTLSEVDRYLREASVPFTTPENRDYTDSEGNRHTTLTIHLQELIEDGVNIVTTHALFDLINMRDFSLHDYHVVIDEVFDVVRHKPGPSREGFENVYVKDGLATLDENGKVIPTSKWLLEGDECYEYKLLEDAKAGRLYVTKDSYYVTVVPPEMFSVNRSCQVNTYLAESSLMAAYLRKFGLPYEVDEDREVDRQVRQRCKQRLSVDHIDFSITNKSGHSGWGYKRQGSLSQKTLKRIATKLDNHRRRKCKGTALGDILVTCRKDLWLTTEERPTRFASDARLTKAHFVPKNSKGTNDYRNFTVAYHLYDIHLNPAASHFLEMSDEQLNAWKTSELIQWLYRTSLRDEVGGPVTAYFASDAMINLVEDWMNDEEDVFELFEAA